MTVQAHFCEIDGRVQCNHCYLGSMQEKFCEGVQFGGGFKATKFLVSI